MMLFLAIALAGVCTLLVMPGASEGQETGKAEVGQPPQDNRPGASPTPRHKAAVSGTVTIDDPAPGFELESSGGGRVRHSSLRGHWVVLAFSDRWRSMVPLEGTHVRLQQMGARVVGICHEKQQTLKTVVRRDSLEMTLLADPTGEVAGIYGLFDWAHRETQPGFFILDTRGIVRLAVIGRILPEQQMMETVEFLMDAHRARR